MGDDALDAVDISLSEYWASLEDVPCDAIFEIPDHRRRKPSKRTNQEIFREAANYQNIVDAANKIDYGEF